MLPVKLTHPLARLPEKAYPDDAGYDAFACSAAVLAPCAVTKVSLGIAIEMPEREGIFCKIESRSGLASRGVWSVGGVIDPGYRGELVALLYNGTQTPFKIAVGDRICQLVFLPFASTQMGVVPMLAPSRRQAAGLGSTGGLSDNNGGPPATPGGIPHNGQGPASLHGILLPADWQDREGDVSP